MSDLTFVRLGFWAGAARGDDRQRFFELMTAIIDCGGWPEYLYIVIVNHWSGLVDRSEYMPAWNLPRVEEQNKNCLQYQGKR